MERDVAGGCGEIPVIVTAAVALTGLAALIAGRLLALHHEAAVKPVHGHQFVVGALLDDLTVIDHEYPVGIAHGFQPVGDHDDRLIVGQFCNGLHQFLFIFRVHIGCLLIQNDDGRVLHDGPRNGHGERLRFEWNMAERRRAGAH